MNEPLSTGKIRLLDLPRNKIFVALEEPLKKDLINTIRESFTNIRKFTLLLKKGPSFFHNLRNNQKIKLEFLLKISSILVKKGFNQFSVANLEKNIKLMGTKRGNIYIIQPKLPFDFNNKYGTYLLSAIFFDGGIDKEYKPHYGNIHFSMRERIVKSVNEVFGKIESKEVNPKRGYFVRFPKNIGIIINHCFNIGIGNKIYCRNRIPLFIFNLNDSNKGKFIRQAFDDDGTVSIPKKTIKILGTINIQKKNFNKNIFEFPLFEDLIKLLSTLGINANPIRIDSRFFSNTQYGKKGEFYRHAFTFSITGRKNLELFNKKIGFNLKYKKKRLEDLLNSYKQKQLRKGEIYKLALKACLKLEKRGIKVTNLIVSNEIKRSYRQTVRVMKVLEKRRLIQLVKPSVNVRGRKCPAIYSVCS